ncbi:hypothetical protein ACLI4U_07745 [Natrialbaceae archaeon A-CW2]
MKRRGFIVLGSASIVAGALHSTGALNSLSAGRGVSIETAAAEDGALLGIRNLDDEGDDPVFENNTSLNMRVELSDNAFDPSVFALSSGEEKSVAIDSDGGAPNVGITATLFEGGTNGQLFEDGTRQGEIVLVRDFSDNAVFGIDGEIQTEGERGDNSITFVIDTSGNNEATIDGFSVQTNVEDVSFEEDGSEFDGNSNFPVTFNSQIDVTITRFRGPGGNGSRPSVITIENENFVSASEADVVITLELAEREDVDLGIEATFD